MEHRGSEGEFHPDESRSIHEEWDEHDAFNEESNIPSDRIKQQRARLS